MQLEGIETFLFLGYFGLVGMETFWAQKIRQEKLTQFTKIFKNIKSSCIIFSSKMSRYSYLLYIFLTRKINTFWSGGIIKGTVSNLHVSNCSNIFQYLYYS